MSSTRQTAHTWLSEQSITELEKKKKEEKLKRSGGEKKIKINTKKI